MPRSDSEHHLCCEQCTVTEMPVWERDVLSVRLLCHSSLKSMKTQLWSAVSFFVIISSERAESMLHKMLTNKVLVKKIPVGVIGIFQLLKKLPAALWPCGRLLGL